MSATGSVCMYINSPPASHPLFSVFLSFVAGEVSGCNWPCLAESWLQPVQEYVLLNKLVMSVSEGFGRRWHSGMAVGICACVKGSLTADLLGLRIKILSAHAHSLLAYTYTMIYIYDLYRSIIVS